MQKHIVFKLVNALVLGILLTACDEPASNPPPLSEADVPPTSTAVTALPDQVFWGDLHTHSRYSLDSYAFGNRALSPDDAFKFAKGKPITAHTGETAQLSRPLDFLLVSDHAEFLGVAASIEDENKLLLDSSLGRQWSSWIAESNIEAVIQDWVGRMTGEVENNNYPSDEIMYSIWDNLTAISDRHNQPGKFTAFLGYEWTSMVNGDNLHRVVLFRDGPEKVKTMIPTSSLESNDPEYLWTRLAEYEASTGGQVMAIPHNGNLSGGIMFDTKTLSGAPLTTAYAKTRIRWEPVYEMTQVKGDAETLPVASPEDVFADYENWDMTDIQMNAYSDDEMLAVAEGGYARPALKRGLSLEKALGVNPYKFGMIGSTDSHTVMATADDDNYYGKFPDSEPSEHRLHSKMGGFMWHNRMLTASGYAAIWATENTREALFDALMRKEVYASTGPRIVLRFFGGWQFEDSDAAAPDMAQTGYAKGVPMGGDLGTSSTTTAPSFLISASKDPDGANLDRVQIVKGWLGDDGTTAEKVYDVVWGDDRKPDANGDLPALPSTVDLKTAKYTNTTGSEFLAAVWTDPDFDADQRAFYYVRVLEIETPRWTTYDAARYGHDLAEDVPATVQERAYSSPIWYTPETDG
ncbi:MAG: DUF3604 domain-containing protein [Parvibaculales bacterium]